jgi:hypothetical protein
LVGKTFRDTAEPVGGCDSDWKDLCKPALCHRSRRADKEIVHVSCGQGAGVAQMHQSVGRLNGYF